MTSYARALTSLLASPTRPKLGLDRMDALLGRLGHPQRRLRVLHVAGTKGKGSTCAMAEAICRAAGLKTGLTTSPHLCCARERIAIDGKMVDERFFVHLARAVERASLGLDASFFEKMIAMAFVAFVEEGVDVAVVEVGLGGRLDATNVCLPAACAITRLGLDHMEHLGPTLVHIAREKAGILKENVPAVTVPQEESAHAEIVRCARDVGAHLEVVPADPTLTPRLHGAHQVENATLAVALVRAAGLAVTDAQVATGLANTQWPGRYETVRTDPALVLDGAHNDTAAAALVSTAQADPVLSRAPVIILGMTAGHDPETFARTLAPLHPRRLIAVRSRSPRSLPASTVARAAARALGVAEESTLDAALDAVSGHPTVVTGSLYLVGEVRARVLQGPCDPALPLF